MKLNASRCLALLLLVAFPVLGRAEAPAAKAVVVVDVVTGFVHTAVALVQYTMARRWQLPYVGEHGRYVKVDSEAARFHLVLVQVPG